MGELIQFETTEQAVSAARLGDRLAWDWLLQRYYPLARKYLAALLDADEVDDVVQETFVAAVTSIRKLRSSEEVGVEGWLLGIARNKAKDHFRRHAREVRKQQAVIALPADPADVAADTFDAKQLRSALMQLSTDQREVLVRRFVLDQSLEHVAATTKRRVGAVKALQHRGLSALRRLMAQDETRS